MVEPKKVSVIVPVFNQSHLTNNFLNVHYNLYNYNKHIELIIVDNGSTDNTPAILNYWINRFSDNLKIIRLEQNKGFSGGNNVGFEQASGEFIIFTNNDVVFSGPYVLPLLSLHEKVPNSLIGAELITTNTGWNLFKTKQQEPVLIPYIAGWLVAGSKDLFSKLGVWDERYYPCDYEDIDLSYTASNLGVNLAKVSIPANHLFGQTASKSTFDRNTITLKNQKIFLDKWQLEKI